MCTLISKLSTSDGEKVQLVHKGHKRESDLADFIKFVDGETQLVNDSLYSQEAIQPHAEKKDKDNRGQYVLRKR